MVISIADDNHQAGCEKIYQEKVSSSLADKPQLTKLLEMIRVGEVYQYLRRVYGLEALPNQTLKFFLGIVRP